MDTVMKGWSDKRNNIHHSIFSDELTVQDGILTERKNHYTFVDSIFKNGHQILFPQTQRIGFLALNVFWDKSFHRSLQYMREKNQPPEPLYIKCHETGEDHYLRLLNLWITPQEGTTTSPMQHVMGRRTKNIFPTTFLLLKPMTNEQVVNETKIKWNISVLKLHRIILIEYTWRLFR